MDSVTHYDTLLAEHYDWMQGGWEAKVEANRAFFHAQALNGPGLAVDLGAGTGYQSIPLAERGFDVLAIDSSAAMLETLRRRAGAMGVRTSLADLCTFADELSSDPALVVCMGDTLSHLASVAQADALLELVARRLAPHGTVVLQFRDLTALPEGDARFLPIRSDEERAFTCFLEEVDAEFVRVHDLVFRRKDGALEQSVSSYLKVRLGRAWLEATLARVGLVSRVLECERGVLTCVAGRGSLTPESR